MIKEKYKWLRRRWLRLWGVRFMDGVPQSVRETCERYGEQVVGTMLAGGYTPSTTDLQQTVYIANELRLHARDWLTENASLREYREKRDFVLEMIVVLLIGVEIGLSIWGIHEGNKEAVVLENVRKSTADTATAMESSKQRLQEMNDAIQKSLGITETMASSMKAQLEILKRDQKDKLAE